MAKKSKIQRTHESAPEVRVGAVFRVPWSNGAGFSVYRVDDPRGEGVHSFKHVRDYEVGSDGSMVVMEVSRG